MKILRTFALALFALSGLASASPDNPQAGREYAVLANPQPATGNGRQVEVIEFFMYHCPGCNQFEPFLNPWAKQKGDAIAFRRIHIPHTPDRDPEAHLFLTLDAMQLEGAMHDQVMHTWHVERKRLKSDADNIGWAVGHGIDRNKFMSVYDSFSVNVKLKNLTRLVNGYGVESTPTIVVAGRYLTNPSMVYDANPGMPDASVGPATLAVIDALIEKARKEQK
jgi:thiol:disulfide interchange protein DsbA